MTAKFKLPAEIDWVDTEDVLVDYRTGDKNVGRIGGERKQNDMVDLWIANFSREMIEVIVVATNEQLVQQKVSETDAGEMLRYFGYWLAFSTQPLKARRDYWDVHAGEYPLFPPPDLGRHGMSFDRHKRLTGALTFVSEKDKKADDPWSEIRPFVDAWNFRQAHAYIASYCLTLDESISRWEGQAHPTGKNSHKDPPTNKGAIPHNSHVPRKPDTDGKSTKILETTGSLKHNWS